MKVPTAVSLAGAAIATLVAATALASPPPEFGRCVAQAGGKYANSGCTKVEAGKEKFEWHAGLGAPGIVKNHFTTHLKEGVVTLESAGANKVVCTGETSSGEITGVSSVGDVVITFTGCESGSLKCNSAGAAAGEVVTTTLAGVIGLEKIAIVEGKEVPAKNKVAEDLESPTGAQIAEASCGPLPITVRGSIFHPVKADAMTAETTEKFIQKGGETKSDHFAGGVSDEHILEVSFGGGPFEESALQQVLTRHFEEKVEINTVE
jgi:hypothetical protein